MEDFENQFYRRELIKCKGGTISVVDVNPKKGGTTILLACGWSETLETIKETIRALAERGMRVFAIDYSDLDYAGVAQIGNKFPASGYIKALSFFRLLEEKKIDKIDVVA